MGALILIAITVGGAIIIASMAQNRSNRAFDARQNNQLEDAVADARRWIERLGSQVLNLAGTDSASTQALADASERYNAASSQISTARTPAQARMARESALEGLHYINAAREIMGLPAGPTLPPLEGQKAAGSVTETRTIEHEGHSVTASPYATPETPNYYPGGRVAGRPVPAGWYSEPWWKSALRTGVWTAGSMLLFSTLFHGMAVLPTALMSSPAAWAPALTTSAAPRTLEPKTSVETISVEMTLAATSVAAVQMPVTQATAEASSTASSVAATAAATAADFSTADSTVSIFRKSPAPLFR